MTGDPLAEETRTYEANVAQWAEAHAGEFVLIRGTDVVGFYETSDQALSAGYQRFGIVPFFVKQVSRQEQAHFVSRLVAPNAVTSV